MNLKISIASAALILAFFGGFGDHFSSTVAEESASAEASVDRADRSAPSPSSMAHNSLPARQAALAATSDAVEKATEAGLGIHGAVEEPLQYDEILDPDRSIEGSYSIGTTNNGGVRGASSIDFVGTHHEILPQHRRRNTNWGTPELIEGLERAAESVATELGGAGLRLGNIGYRQGGRIPWSSSHQAGRDADIAFYALDDAGRSVPTPRFVEFDDEGKAIGHPLYFDVPRNWAFVRALLTDPTLHVQWLFISEGLKFQLLEHAAEIDEPAELIERASLVLHQPTNAAPHADHFHLRVGCSRADRLETCVDWGPRWQWHDWHRDALFARSREVQRAFDSDDPQLRRRAFEFLHELRSPFAPDLAVVYGIDDPDPEVQQVAFDIVDALPIGSDVGIRALGQAFENEFDEDRHRALYGALARAEAPATPELALERFYAAGDADEQHLALDALRHRMQPDLVSELTAAVRSTSAPELRDRLVTQIRRITARSHGLDWSVDSIDDDHQQALAKWEQWARESDSDRRQLLLELLADYGVEKWNDVDAIDNLIPLLAEDADYKRYNVNLVLSEWTGRWVPREWGSGDAAYNFWSNWWDENRDHQIEAATAAWAQ